jgi:hypothetical protein
MMLFRVGQLPIWVVLFLVGATSARAESELQKFQSTIPPGLRLATASYEACASVAAIDAKRETATVKFPDVEAKIAKDCDRYFSLKNIGPCYTASPETKRFLACDTKMRDAKSKYISCVDDAVTYLVPNSLDSSDVVADAAVGLCSAQRADTVDSMACFGVDASKANDAVLELDRKLKSSALGKIAAARAEIARRQRQPPD